MASCAERAHSFIKPGSWLSNEQDAFDLHGDSLFSSKGNSFEPLGQADRFFADHKDLLWQVYFFPTLGASLG